jgi:hypothetical protein
VDNRIFGINRVGLNAGWWTELNQKRQKNRMLASSIQGGKKPNADSSINGLSSRVNVSRPSNLMLSILHNLVIEKLLLVKVPVWMTLNTIELEQRGILTIGSDETNAMKEVHKACDPYLRDCSASTDRSISRRLNLDFKFGGQVHTAVKSVFDELQRHEFVVTDFNSQHPAIKGSEKLEVSFSGDITSGLSPQLLEGILKTKLPRGSTVHLYQY